MSRFYIWQCKLLVMAVLALESSSDFCSLALSVDGSILEHNDAACRQHNEIILPSLDALLIKAGVRLSELEAVVYGRGPGSFTGVRVAASVAQAIALAHDVPIHAVSSLAALALSAPPDTHVLTVLDARLGELYWAAYYRHGGSVTELVADAVGTPEKVSLWLEQAAVSGWLVLGEGGGLLQPVWPQLSHQQQDFSRMPKAKDLLPLVRAGAAGTAQAALPVYLRAKRPWRK